MYFLKWMHCVLKMVIFPEDVHHLPSSSPACGNGWWVFQRAPPKSTTMSVINVSGTEGLSLGVAFRTAFNLLIESSESPAVIPAGKLTMGVYPALSWWKHPADHLQRSGRDWQCSLSPALSGQRLKGGKMGPVISAGLLWGARPPDLWFLLFG